MKLYMSDYILLFAGGSGENSPPRALSNGAPVRLRGSSIEAIFSEAVGGEKEQMTQTTNRFFDEIARLMNDAAGVASGVRREFDTLFRTQAERILRDLDVVKRDEFEAVKEMARLAREENEALKMRIVQLEAKIAAGSGP